MARTFHGNVNKVLESLRSKSEYAEGDWGTVYLDNARPAGMSANLFRACLAELSQKGLYKVIDNFAWGKVKTAFVTPPPSPERRILPWFC